MKEVLQRRLDEGGRDADSPAGRHLSEVVRHIRIMRPFRLVGLSAVPTSRVLFADCRLQTLM